MTWIEAQQFCSQNNGSYLVEIFSQDHQDFLLVQLYSLKISSWWIGLTDIGNIASNNWFWAHSLRNASFTSWGTDTHNHEQNFAFMDCYAEFNWYPITGRTTTSPICQFFP